MTRRLAFLGTPGAAVPTLHALADAGHEIVIVVTRKDARRRRSAAPEASPVKVAAKELGLPVSHELRDVLDANVDLGVVVAFGELIPASTLQQVEMLNVHFSLLPRWRGAAPVERAILAGDEETGVCVMRLEERLDTGPVFVSASTKIDNKNVSDLTDELSEIGSRLLVDLLNHDPLPSPTAQVGEATYAAKVLPLDFALSPDLKVADLERRVRAGRASCEVDGRRLVIESARIGEVVLEPGEVKFNNRFLHLGSIDGDLVVERVIPDGARSMTAESWWAGTRMGDGAKWTGSAGRRP